MCVVSATGTESMLFEQDTAQHFSGENIAGGRHYFVGKVLHMGFTKFALLFCHMIIAIAGCCLYVGCILLIWFGLVPIWIHY